VGSDSVSIAKQLTQPPYFRQLVVDPLTVDPTTPIHMRAVCTGDANSQHLQLFLNDQPVAQADDTDAPFSSGSVGLTVATGPGDSSIVAEFRNFSVKTVSGTGS
jgi:hypothetical protein